MTDAAPAKPANPRHKWYIVNAYSNFEKKVAEQLREQSKQQGLDDAFSEILVPTEDVVEIRRVRGDVDGSAARGKGRRSPGHEGVSHAEGLAHLADRRPDPSAPDDCDRVRAGG